MIRGLGCDLCAIARMEKIIQDGRFLARHYTEAECAYIRDRKMQAQTAAGLFAAKEAFLKALGTGLGGVALSDIEITHTALGAPEYLINEKMREALESRGVQRLYLSISHDGDYAMATAVLEGD